MPLGPISNETLDKGPVGLLERFVFQVAAIIGTTLGVAGAAASGFIAAARNFALHNNRNVMLSPAEAAAAVVKGHAAFADAADEAAYGGLDTARFRVLVDTTGNPPGPETLLARWRLGKISDDEFRHGLIEGYLRNEWVPFYEDRRYEPVGWVEYLHAAVQGHEDVEVAVRNAGLQGVTEVDARMVYETLGNPPGVMEMVHAWKRGLIDEATVDQAVRESRIKNKYLSVIKRLGEYFPPPRTTTTLLAHGAITEDKARELFRGAGLSPELADAYVQSAVHSKTASHKEFTASQVRTLYADRLLTRDMAKFDLVALGYGDVEADMLLNLADAQARAKVRTQFVGRLRTLYVAGKINRTTAVEDLSKVELPADQAGELVDLWELERTTPSRVLTVGQLNQAVKKGIITAAEFVSRAIALGYTAEDAQILLEIDVPPTAGATPGG